MSLIGVSGPISPEVLDVIAVASGISSRELPLRDVVLVLVAELGWTIPHELAQHLDVRPRVAHLLLADLIGEGLAVRLPRRADPKDRRRGAGRVGLTPTGDDAAGAVRRQLAAIHPCPQTVVSACGAVDRHLALVIASCRLHSLPRRILVALFERPLQGYDELRRATHAGERQVRAAVRALQLRRQLDRRVVGERQVKFRFELAEFGREVTERIVTQIDAEIRRAALAREVATAHAA